MITIPPFILEVSDSLRQDTLPRPVVTRYFKGDFGDSTRHRRGQRDHTEQKVSGHVYGRN